MSDVNTKLAELAAKVKVKNAAAEAAKAKARDDIARATTVADLKSALLRYLA